MGSRRPRPNRPWVHVLAARPPFDPLIGVVEASWFNLVVDGQVEPKVTEMVIDRYVKAAESLRRHTAQDVARRGGHRTVDFSRPRCPCSMITARFLSALEVRGAHVQGRLTQGILLFFDAGTSEIALNGSQLGRVRSLEEDIECALSAVKCIPVNADGPVPVALVGVGGLGACPETAAPLTCVPWLAGRKHAVPVFCTANDPHASGEAFAAAVTWLIAETLRLRRETALLDDAAARIPAHRTFLARLLPAIARPTALRDLPQPKPLPPCTCHVLSRSASRWQCSSCSVMEQRRAYCCCDASAVNVPWCAPWPVLREVLLAHQGRTSQSAFALLSPDVFRLIVRRLHDLYFRDFHGRATDVVRRESQRKLRFAI
mmetsp:Transcript_15241/g.44589  ORF Transcript_15241/g.44589 Transcript_15241/m.44589 type:complete len:373 (-) Transcript_15241:2502-3620(-)